MTEPPALAAPVDAAEPHDFDALLEFLTLRAVPGVETVEDGVYRRVVRHHDDLQVVEIRRRGHGLVVVADEGRREPTSGERSRAGHLLDSRADPAAITSVLGTDDRLAPSVVAHRGLRVPGAWDGFEVAVRAVLGQQVSVKGASTLAGRLVEMAGERRTRPDRGLSHAFPAADDVADADLEGLGVPFRRRVTLRDLAAAVATGEVVLDGSVDSSTVRAQLVAIDGIGPWTAEYVAMRVLHDRDAFPASDLGLRKALGAPGQPASSAAVAAAGERWRPFRSYAAMHLWLGSSAVKRRR